MFDSDPRLWSHISLIPLLPEQAETLWTPVEQRELLLAAAAASGTTTKPQPSLHHNLKSVPLVLTGNTL
jgi:hypothetical protein